MRRGTTLKQLKKKLNKLERKYEKIPEACVLDRARVLKSAMAVERDIKRIKETLKKVLDNLAIPQGENDGFPEQELPKDQGSTPDAIPADGEGKLDI